jgi:hypothetical protein
MNRTATAKTPKPIRVSHVVGMNGRYENIAPESCVPMYVGMNPDEDYKYRIARRSPCTGDETDFMGSKTLAVMRSHVRGKNRNFKRAGLVGYRVSMYVGMNRQRSR